MRKSDCLTYRFAFIFFFYHASATRIANICDISSSFAETIKQSQHQKFEDLDEIKRSLEDLEIANQQGSPRKRLIFTTTQGHGETFLYHLLNNVEDESGARAAVLFLPHPSMTGTDLTSARRRGLMATEKQRANKASAILGFIKDHPNTTYIEINNMFVIDFWDVVMNRFLPEQYDISLLVVRRSLLVTAYALAKNRFTKTQGGLFYLTGDKVAILPRLLGRPADELEKAVGFILDLEAQIKRFQDRYPFVNVVETRLEELHIPEELDRVLSALRLQPLPGALFHRLTPMMNKHQLDVKAPEEDMKVVADRFESVVKAYRGNGWGQMLPSTIPTLTV